MFLPGGTKQGATNSLLSVMPRS